MVVTTTAVIWALVIVLIFIVGSIALAIAGSNGKKPVFDNPQVGVAMFLWLFLLVALFFASRQLYDCGYGIPATVESLPRNEVFRFLGQSGQVGSTTEDFQNAVMLQRANGTLQCVFDHSCLRIGTEFVQVATMYEPTTGITNCYLKETGQPENWPRPAKSD